MSRSIAYTSSPLLASPTPVWRSKFIVAVIALSFAGLVGRAVYIQVIENEFFQRQGEVRFARTLALPASRGRILDRNGIVLASSIPVPSIWAIPEDVPRDPAGLKKLAKLLDLPLAELNKKLEDEDKTFVWLKRQVDESVGNEIAALGLKGVYQRKEYKRQYPEGEAAAHVVGFTNVEDQGQEGMELTFNKALGGRDGSRRVIKDRMGRVVEDVREQIAPVDGRDLQLSIDSKVQFFAYQTLKEAVLAHKAKAGSVVVLDVQTGEVLALANYPSFVPDKRRNLSGAQLRNRALTDTFEPGSTMKPFIIAAALNQGMVTPESKIQTAPGRMSIGSATISDTHPNGLLSVTEVIQKSSNVGTVKIAMQMAPRKMWEMYSQVGFGQKPELPFPGAVSGRLRPYKSWRPIEQATMSYGYGVSVSLFQLAHAYTIFGRDGDLVPVTMFKMNAPAVGVPVIEARHARDVRHMLHLVTGPGGTAQKAQAMGYSVGGKTGTAHKVEGKGYADKKYRGVFAGLAPIDAPRIAVAVMIDEPSNGQYYGGLTAAPVFSQTVQQTLRVLGIAPDQSVVPQVITDAVEESF
ncbi:peptidoglycan D,D-transpeptidase FtsI family protein [Rhodoferax sp.]|jgi:cell division protein FtsI (penicillin-binding protein 3)|uniref:peptidoglycan D,D-transpeptidase FtsI family protein n=1 Tax=Rhodoferax sp. TaxID=50421 RepID=UPI0027179BED|nr:penicillin-binding protein 2 [Rhodoferax sp.]MDO9144454.1 penicillin-binding protein 2 [Rhodoferax sp.]MDP1530842.1 penicillin-binding protein 2 [Rhodoferax sp.]MDP1945136.1 penicillin-binding protein 2 [Rhodoferax sp.]MDP2442865.1 penicillin-binding protein 2 [Rhodoferax sp.]MDP3193350.1 penicillin-binding protein 2 [Rhodoferax sp.]